MMVASWSCRRREITISIIRTLDLLGELVIER